MSVGKAIYNILSNDAGVTALVSTRVYPDTVPQEASFPYVAYTIVSTSPLNYKDGASPLDEVSVQVDMYSRSYATTQDIAAAVRSALDRYTGLNSSINIDKILFENEGAGTYEAMQGVFWASQDYLVRVKR